MAISLANEQGVLKILIDNLEREAPAQMMEKVSRMVAEELFREHGPGLIKMAGQECKEAIAREFWEAYKTQIMAEIDLKGLSSLIAAYASREIAGK